MPMRKIHRHLRIMNHTHVDLGLCSAVFGLFFGGLALFSGFLGGFRVFRVVRLILVRVCVCFRFGIAFWVFGDRYDRTYWYCGGNHCIIATNTM